MEASADVFDVSKGVEDEDDDEEEEEVLLGEEQKDDSMTDKWRDTAETAQSAVEQASHITDEAPTASTQNFVLKDGTNNDNEGSKESVAKEEEVTFASRATSTDSVTKEEEDDEEEEEEEGYMMTTDVDVTEEEEDDDNKSDVKEKSEDSSRGGNLDQLMDIENVDQDEQEAPMKAEEDTMLASDNCSGMEEDTVPSLESCIQLVKRSLQAASGPPRPAPAGNPPSPSPVTVKDEPVDEEYNQALFLPHPSSSSVPTDGIKDEPDAPNELMISSVFSVEGRSSAARLMPKPSPPLPALGSSSSSSSSSSSATSTTLSVVCFSCHRFLIKGQMAYQKKGTTDIFCSPTCLSAKPQEAAAGVKSCHHCCKPVPRPHKLILAPIGGGSSVQDFCSAACLTACSPKLPPAPQKKGKAATPAVVMRTCAVCKKHISTFKHRLVLQGVSQCTCSNVCFLAFCTAHKLSPGTCACCGEAFICQPVVLKVATGNKTLCSDACLATYKQKGSFSYACCMCETMTPLSDMLDAKNSQGVVELFCTSSCLLACRIQRISASGVELPCSHCSLYKVPCYHLAMSDNSIRNFCSLPCVLGFQDRHLHKTQDNSTTALSAAATPAASPIPIIATTIQLSANTKTKTASSSSSTTTSTSIIAHPTTSNNNNVPSTTTTTTTSTSTSTSSLTDAASKSAVPKLLCPVCNCAITVCPELVQEKDRLVFLCGLECAEEFKTLQGQESSCEYCKLLKVPADVKRIGSKDCSFCSEGCKQLYKHELAKQWGSHCRCCAYCFSISRAMVTTRYSGKNEEFCSEHCRNKYTLLIQQLAMCEACGTRGHLTVTLPLLGAPKRFCRLQCLLKFCCSETFGKKLAITSEAPLVVSSPDPESATPVIGNVVSLASHPPTQPGNRAPNMAEQLNLYGAHRKFVTIHSTVPGPRKRKILAPATSASSSSSTSLLPSTPSTTTLFFSPALSPPSTSSVSTQTDKAPPPPVKVLKNKSLLCRPMVQDQEVSCKPDLVDTEVQTDEPIRVMVVPVPVPVYIPVPMAMYSQYCPAPMTIPVPLPVPVMLPVTLDSVEGVMETIRQLKDKIPSDPLEADLILMAEIVAEQQQQQQEEEEEERKKEQEGKKKELRGRGRRKRAEKRTRPVEQEKDGLDLLNEYINNNYSRDQDPEVPESPDLDTWEEATPAPGLLSDNRPMAREKLQPIRDIPVGGSFELPGRERPPSPPRPPEPRAMDIEADMPVETLEELETARLSEAKRLDGKRRTTLGRRQRKARDKKKGRQAVELSEDGEAACRAPRLESKYGIDAWQRWVRWRRTQPELTTPRINSHLVELREDVLKCATMELSFGLCRFAVEVRRPNGEPYLPDSLFYLCLGIQQHLFENGRVENIFTDVFYSKFSMEITKQLKEFKPSITRNGYIHSRVEEDYLWDCKQLGAYSPTVLLNTLLFFCSKFLGFTTVQQHRRLSFAHFMRCSRTNADGSKTVFLRFYPPVPLRLERGRPSTAAKRSRCDHGDDNNEEGEGKLDMVENQENPLRCPVRLYEFYLSKCSETVKQRSNVFYLRPERSCVPNSPLWFSGSSLDDGTLGGMLTRILSVREMHLRAAPADTVTVATAATTGKE